MTYVPLSRFKRLIRAAEIITILGLCFAFYLAVYFALEDGPIWFSGKSFPILFLGMFFSFGYAAALGGELAYTFHGPLLAGMEGGLKLEELRSLLHWTPKSLKFCLPVGFLVGFFGALAASSSTFSDAHSPVEALAWLAVPSGFYLMALPILSSAARMPGTYQDNLETLQAKTAPA